MRFWTSDLHLGHRLMCTTRGFETVEEHDEAIVTQWNKQVSPQDEVWILGDLTLQRMSRVAPLVQRLHGAKRLVLGNHDTAHPLIRGWETEHQRAQELFTFVGTLATVRFHGVTALMSHFPYTTDHSEEARHMQYRLPDLGNFLIHGHTHSVERTSGAGTLHVGWDAWGRLVTEGEVSRAVMEWAKTRA